MSVDFPVRTGLMYHKNLPKLYVAVSTTANYVTCIGKEILPICDEYSMICSGVKGGTVYASRGYIISPNFLYGGFVGVVNNIAYWCAKKFNFDNTTIGKYGTSIVIEAAEAFFTGAGTFLGAVKGIGLSFGKNILETGFTTLIEYIKEYCTETNIDENICFPKDFLQHTICLIGETSNSEIIKGEL